jgi:hypothetical protein
MSLFDPTPDYRPIPETCPNCRRDTTLQLETAIHMWPQWSSNLAPPFTDYARLNVWTCMFCNKTTLIRVLYPEADEQFRAPASIEMMWPERPPRELAEEAPDAVRSLFREASIAENAGALRGAAALYRAAVEELVGDRQAVGANLRDRIDALADQGVDADVVRDLHEARLTANWSLHEGTQFSPDEIADVAGLINDAVETLYVEPARRAAMREAREQRRRGRTEESEDEGPGGEPNA